MRRECLLVCLCLLPSLSVAQENIQNFDAAALEKFIRDDLKKDFTKQENPQTNVVTYDIKGTEYYVTLNPKGRFILFCVVAPAGNIDLQKINNWNRDAVFSRSYLSDNMLKFEVPVNIATGVSRDTLKNYYDRLEAEWKMF